MENIPHLIGVQFEFAHAFDGHFGVVPSIDGFVDVRECAADKCETHQQSFRGVHGLHSLSHLNVKLKLGR